MPCGCPDGVGTLAFDHNLILSEAILQMRSMAVADSGAALRAVAAQVYPGADAHAFEIVFGRKVDVRNFHKKVASMSYVVPLDEYQRGVAHRAARFYRFDRKAYNRQRR